MSTHIYNSPGSKTKRRSLRTDSTKPEQVLWYNLRNNNLGEKFRRQYGVGRYILDFYCPAKRVAIEVDGDSHFTTNAIAKDQTRQEFLALQEIKCIRFTNFEVLSNIDGVLDKIKSYLT